MPFIKPNPYLGPPGLRLFSSLTSALPTPCFQGGDQGFVPSQGSCTGCSFHGKAPLLYLTPTVDLANTPTHPLGGNICRSCRQDPCQELNASENLRWLIQLCPLHRVRSLWGEGNVSAPWRYSDFQIFHPCRSRTLESPVQTAQAHFWARRGLLLDQFS